LKIVFLKKKVKKFEINAFVTPTFNSIERDE